MNRSSCSRRFFWTAILVAMLCGWPMQATPQFQQPGQGAGPPPGLPIPGQPAQPPPADPATAIYTRHMMEYQIAQRFKKVRQDTGKLVDLTAQLQQTVAKSAATNSSSDALHQAAQIEKLAKSVNQNTRD